MKTSKRLANGAKSEDKERRRALSTPGRKKISAASVSPPRDSNATRFRMHVKEDTKHEAVVNNDASKLTKKQPTSASNSRDGLRGDESEVVPSNATLKNEELHVKRASADPSQRTAQARTLSMRTQTHPEASPSSKARIKVQKDLSTMKRLKSPNINKLRDADSKDAERVNDFQSAKMQKRKPKQQLHAKAKRNKIREQTRFNKVNKGLQSVHEDHIAKEEIEDFGSDSGDSDPRMGLNQPLEEDWAWKMFDRHYFKPLATSSITQFEQIRAQQLCLVASNMDYMHGFTMSEVECIKRESMNSQTDPINIPNRGRFYKDIWEEEEYLEQLRTIAREMNCSDNVAKFTLYQDDSDLVSHYEVELFEQSLQRLESAELQQRSDTINHPASWGKVWPCPVSEQIHPACWSKTPSDGAESDEISTAIQSCVKALIPQAMSNWQKMRDIYDRMLEEIELDPIFERERNLTSEIESYYQRWKQLKTPFHEKMTLSESRLASKIREYGANRAGAITFAAHFALTLQLGDGIDYLDHTGLWEPGYVVDIFVEGQSVLSHVKIQMSCQGSISQEWCCVYSGRIMPPGTSTLRTAPVLNVKIHPTHQNDTCVIVNHNVIVPVALKVAPMDEGDITPLDALPTVKQLESVHHFNK
ncbi:hypothetical protein AeMF1_005085 [Aphanomyces euteiches]|nr:hypothetical protein AeMF1_014323 [Aphanomyces euteiches]KAH9112510.1 hypothetical protein AeMF1_013182 [Aphanomyces euteiches]KAH9118703.1 hypothetical protein AeMF1_008280 [Aphanomyces euteiches]KAH9121164.1 hypothetical protein AeMF1_007001 [Aphanomyces euteiches]KAH9124096.1 hypothetical protein AeMF1_005085 [Aphanomyces euteiches]